MSFEDTRPAALDGTDAGGGSSLAAFRVTHPHERATLLRELRDGSAPVILSEPGGAAVACTLWSMDANANRLHFSAEPEHPLLPRLLAAGEATAVSYLDSVKLQFDLHAPVLVRGRDTAIIQCSFPRELYRFQRRSTYRVRVAQRHAPKARLRHPSIPEMTIELRVIDVSVGGCALWLPPDVPPLQSGTQLSDVTVMLDPQTQFSVALSLQHVGEYYPGDEGVRVGCAWLPLSPVATRSLQRWIDQSQKRHRLVLVN